MSPRPRPASRKAPPTPTCRTSSARTVSNRQVREWAVLVLSYPDWRITAAPLPCPLANRHVHQGFPATISSLGVRTRRRSGSASAPVATRNATSTSVPPDLSSPPAGNVPAGVKPFPNVSCTLQQENIRILKVVDEKVEEPCTPCPLYEWVIKNQRERQHLAHCNLSLQCNWNRAYAAHAKNGYLRVVGNRSPMDATYGSVVGDGERSTVELLQPQSALLRPLD